MATRVLSLALVLAVLAACAFSADAIVGAPTTTEVVTAQNCSCQTCAPLVSTSGVCTVDPYNPNHSRIVTCDDNVHTCATLMLFNGTQCQVFDNAFTVVCGRCMSRPNPLAPGTTFYAVAKCDPITQTVTWDSDCNSDCSQCNSKNAAVHPVDQCSMGLKIGTVFNQGLSSCDAVNVTIFSGVTCAGATVGNYSVAQYECSGGEFFSCSPKNPGPVPPSNTSQIILSHCIPNKLGCVQCEDFAFPSGQCAPTPPRFSNQFHSHQATCDTSMAYCAHLVINNNSQCTDLIGIGYPVCGSCQQFNNETSFSKVVCNMTTNTITILKGCNSFCDVSSCTLPSLTHTYLQCSTGYIANTSVFNRGIQPCETITFTGYSSTNCATGTSVATMQQAAGVCEFNRRATCTGRTVTVQNCSDKSQPNSSNTFGENACAPDGFGFYRKYRCNNQMPSCVQLVNFKDAQCTQYNSSLSAVCGACMQNYNPNTKQTEWMRVACNLQTQQVGFLQCSDNQCGTCNQVPVISHVYDQCTAGRYGGGVFNQGILPCDAVTIDVFADAACETAVVAQWTVGQHQCNFDQFVACSGDALPPAPGGSAIVFSKCPPPQPNMPSSCTQCFDQTFAADACIPNVFGQPGYHLLHCDTMENWCADIVVSPGTLCQGYMGNIHPVCNSCVPSPFNRSDFLFIACNQIDQSVVVSYGCDNRCMQCTHPGNITHGYLQCSVPLIPGPQQSFFNRGLINCATVSAVEFSDQGCSPMTATAWYPMPIDFCEWDHRMQCAPQTITIENCTSTTSNVSIVGENSCTGPDPWGKYRQIGCMTQTEQCVQLLQFTDASCSTFRNAITAVCGTCQKLVDWKTNQVTYAYFSCNPFNQTVTFVTCAASDCSGTCSGPTKTHPFDQCSSDLSGGSIYNQGVSPCDAVNISVYNQSGCVTAPEAIFTVGQHQCTFGEDFECSAQPVPTPTIGGQIVFSQCPSHDFACMHCNVSVFSADSCQPLPSGSQSMVCDPFEHMCVDFVLHNNTQCSGYVGQHTPVCGECTRWFGEQTWTLVQCNPSQQNVTIFKGCQQMCNPSQCTSSYQHGFLQCVSNTSVSLFNRGVIPCTAVHITEFNQPGCPRFDSSSIAGQYLVAQDVCQWDHRIQCTPHTVVIQNCTDPKLPAVVTTEGSCQLDNFGAYRQYFCHNRANLCAKLVIFGDTQCKQYRDSFTAVCFTCQKRFNFQTNQYEFMNFRCDFANQTVFVDGGCDPMCRTCQQPNIASHGFMMCSLDHQGGSIYNQGLQPCDTVDVNVYNQSSCTGFPNMHWTMGQFDCNDQQYVTCSADSLPFPPPPGQIIIAMCPNHDVGCINCDRAVIANGQCWTAPPQETRFGSVSMSCDTTDSWCVDFVLHNNTQCSGYVGQLTPVCGSCAQYGRDNGFTMTVCDKATHMVTQTTGCDSQCTPSSCTGGSSTYPFMACSPKSFEHNEGVAVFNRGLMPCATITRTSYSQANCAGTATATFQVVQGVCEFDHRFDCTPHTVTVQNCTCETCNALTVSEFSCTQDAYGYYRQYQCQNQLSMCAQLVAFTNPTCTAFSNVYSVVCGSCFKRAEGEYNRITCNPNTQLVTVITGCDSLCNTCTGNSILQPFDACSAAPGSGYVYNQGVARCDTVNVTVYQAQNCSGTPLASFSLGQYECSVDQLISCSGEPVAPSPPANSLMWFDCPANDAACMMCSTVVEPTGTCQVTSFGSHSASCDTYGGWCADMIVHSGNACQNFMGRHTPVCGSCTLWFGQTTYTKVDCAPMNQSLIVSIGCNEMCQQCTKTVVHPYQQCSTAAVNQSMSLFNRGIMPCQTVTVTEYTAAGCPSNAIRAQFQIAQDLCNIGHRVQCINATAPSGGDGGGGLSAGGAVGVTIAVLAGLGAAGFFGLRYFKRRGGSFPGRGQQAYRPAEMHEEPMHEATPRGYGGVNS